MNIERMKEYLSGLFVPRKEGLEGVCFNGEYMDKRSEAYEIYRAFSDAQQNSGLSFDFSYNIASKVCDILINCEEWDVADESINEYLPIYTAEIMEIYKADSGTVDEACEELGEGDSVARALNGWYLSISNMLHEVKEKLTEIIE